MTESINKFARFAVLFRGSAFSHVDIFTLDNTHNKNPLRIELGGKKGDSQILGIEIKTKRLLSRDIVEILKENKSKDIGAFYFFFDVFRHCRRVRKGMQELSLKGELYGIDPGYYHSFVPLCGPSCKSIEQFILNLKSNTSRKDNIKQFVKKCLISLNFSHFLYENFIIIAQPLRK